MDEKKDLDGKRERLAAFFGTPIFAGLPPDEQGRLERQLAVMDEYSSILGERIAHFA